MEFSFTKDCIKTEDGLIVMHEWERPIMKAMADWVCQDGGDIIEFGFGMGISANYIQEHDIKSHTICENHPGILENLKKWAEDKPNVRVLEGNWYDNLSKMDKYDGVLFDTYADENLYDFPNVLPDICKDPASVTWWNLNPVPECCFGRIPAQKYIVMDVNPPQNDYFNHKIYLLPQFRWTKDAYYYERPPEIIR